MLTTLVLGINSIGAAAIAEALRGKGRRQRGVDRVGPTGATVIADALKVLGTPFILELPTCRVQP